MHTLRLITWAVIMAITLLGGTLASADIDGAVAANKFVRTAPDITVSNVADMTDEVTRVRRGQTVYFVFKKFAGNTWPLRDGELQTGTLCSVSGSATAGCATAPLFIASESALVCVNANMEDSASNTVVVEAYTCMDSECLRDEATNAKGPSAEFQATGDESSCAEVNGTGQDIATVNAGGSYIYFLLDNNLTGNPSSLVIWVTGH